ncbi:MAG TPA: sigma-70 family RNA polymerase sigma factor, partial [Polyangiales bacterium]|nr:sigma-70 family RNA polymerase sigma factor [Polyangiales bacterium]
MVTRPSVESSVRAALEQGNPQLAATRALERLGPDVIRFLRARLRDQPQAEEAYLQFCEDFWVGLAAFRWESNLRTWMFVLARNAATRAALRGPREVALGTGHENRLQDLHEQIRTETARYIRTEVKDRMREIRQRLDEDDQTLLILRIDRKLEWSELAVVMGEVPI